MAAIWTDDRSTFQLYDMLNSWAHKHLLREPNANYYYISVSVYFIVLSDEKPTGLIQCYVSWY